MVGAGLSGLAAAYRLQQAGWRVVVLERSERPGGLARTERLGGYVLDTGPDLVNATFERYLTLARELGLGDRIVASSQVVDVLRGGRAITVDRSRPLALASSPVLSLRGKLALARGLLRLWPQLRRIDPYALTDHAAADHGTAHDLCTRHFNDEVTDHIVDPILRVFAGTGARTASGLSVLAAFSVGAKTMLSVRGGMAVLPGELGRRLDVRYQADVVSVDDSGDGVRLCYRDQDGHLSQLTADTCVLAVSYHAAVPMWPALEEAGGDFGRELKDLALLSISLGYAAPSPTRSYAVLVPTKESEEALLVTMQQNKAPDRVPPGKTLVSVYTEAAATDRMMQRTDDEIVHWAATFVERYYPSLRGHLDLATVARWPHTGYWPTPGYWKGISEMRQRLPNGNIHVTSTLFGSGGMERAILGGQRTAERVLRNATKREAV